MRAHHADGGGSEQPLLVVDKLAPEAHVWPDERAPRAHQRECLAKRQTLVLHEIRYHYGCAARYARHAVHERLPAARHDVDQLVAHLCTCKRIDCWQMEKICKREVEAQSERNKVRYAIEVRLDIREGRVVDVKLNGFNTRRPDARNLDSAIDDELDAELS